MLGLQDERLEYRHRMEGRPTALGSIAIAQPFQQPAAEILEIDRRLQNLQRVTDFAQPLKMLRQPE
jgi:hypothetical protein